MARDNFSLKRGILYSLFSPNQGSCACDKTTVLNLYVQKCKNALQEQLRQLNTPKQAKKHTFTGVKVYVCKMQFWMRNLLSAFHFAHETGGKCLLWCGQDFVHLLPCQDDKNNVPPSIPRKLKFDWSGVLDWIRHSLIACDIKELSERFSRTLVVSWEM